MHLNKEAEEYAKSISKNQTYREYLEKSFKSGVNSKYAKAKILQAQIDVLKPYLEWNDEVSFSVKKDIEKLEQQLKQLEND